MLDIYQVTGQYRQALDELSALDMDEQTIKDTLSGLLVDVEDAVINMASYVRNLEAEEAAIKKAKDELTTKQAAVQQRAKKVKEYLYGVMSECKTKKIKSAIGEVAIRKAAPSLEIENENFIPKKYFIDVPQLDKKLIKEDLKSGASIDGCKLKQNEYVFIGWGAR